MEMESGPSKRRCRMAFADPERVFEDNQGLLLFPHDTPATL